MVRKFAALLIVSILALPFAFAQVSVSDRETLKTILEKAKQNEELARNIGFEQSTTSTKLKDGKVSEKKIRAYQMIWIDNEPYLELLSVNGAAPDEEEKKEEKKRKAKFIKAMREERKEDPEDVTWDEMYAKYDFHRLPSDSIGHYVFSFQPKTGKLSQRSRTEKVLNHITGTVWADPEFNIVQVKAKLVDNVKFGLGILGTIEKLELKYRQDLFGQIQVPSYFYVHFKARVALVKVEERKIESTFTDFFQRQAGDTSGMR